MSFTPIFKWLSRDEAFQYQILLCKSLFQSSTLLYDITKRLLKVLKLLKIFSDTLFFSVLRNVAVFRVLFRVIIDRVFLVSSVIKNFLGFSVIELFFKFSLDPAVIGFSLESLVKESSWRSPVIGVLSGKNLSDKVLF